MSDAAVEELTERYRRIGGRSPLDEMTERQRAALEAELGVPVFVGMKHWQPRIADAVEEALAGGAETIVGLVLAPHYRSCRSTATASGWRRLSGRAELRFVERWEHPVSPTRSPSGCRALTGTWFSRRTACRREFSTRRSLPGRAPRDLAAHRRARRARPGHSPIRARARRRALAGPGHPGRAGHARGVERVLVCPIGFVSDHLEILWDIDVEARERAGELGLELDGSIP